MHKRAPTSLGRHRGPDTTWGLPRRRVAPRVIYSWVCCVLVAMSGLATPQPASSASSAASGDDAERARHRVRLAGAEVEDPFVREAQNWMDEAEYTKAQRSINQGLSRQQLPDTTRIQLYLLEGTCWVSLGQPGRARSSYAKVLTLSPGHSLSPRTSPKVREVFETTRKEMLDAGELDSMYEPLHTPVANLPSASDAEVKLSFANAERAASIQRVVLYLRRLGTSDYTAIDARRSAAGKADFIAHVPPFLLVDERDTYAMEYYLEAYATSGARLAKVAGPMLPLSFLVVPRAELTEGGSASADSGESLWLPVTLGIAGGAVVVAGLTVGLVFALTPKTGSAIVHVAQ